MMLTIEGIFDGQQINLLEFVPFTKQKRVLVTFLDEQTSDTDVAVTQNPIQALRGCAKHVPLTAALLRARQADLAHEEIT